MESDGYIGYESGLYLWDEKYESQAIFQNREDGTLPARGRHRFEIFFDTDELEKYWQSLTSAGVKPIHPIIEMNWGQQVLRVYDPDGNIVELGEPLETFVGRFLRQGLSIEQTSQRTFTPLETVRKIAEKI